MIPAERLEAATEAGARAEYEHVEGDSWDEAHRDDRRDYIEAFGVGLAAALEELNTSTEGNDR